MESSESALSQTLPGSAGVENASDPVGSQHIDSKEQNAGRGRASRSLNVVAKAVLHGHEDEVWDLQWSHSGRCLATASKDKSAIIWQAEWKEGEDAPAFRSRFILRGHRYPVGRVAWSLDDTVLLTGSERYIYMWNAKSGLLLRELEVHTEVVTALVWLPDNSGFISAGLDKKIILWAPDAVQQSVWNEAPMRVTDLQIAQDSSKLVVVGMRPLSFPAVDHDNDTTTSNRPLTTSGRPSIAPTNSNIPVQSIIGNQIVVYDLSSKELELSVESEGEVTSIKISKDSRYALLNRVLYFELNAVGEVHMCEISTGRTVHKYTGHTQSRHVIRSGFGGQDEEFIISGCEGNRVHIWDRDSETPLAVLSNDGSGSVNSVAWHPTSSMMFASCSDDHTTRVWEVRLT